MVRWLHFSGASGPQAASSGEEPDEPVAADHQIIGPSEPRFVAVHPEAVSPRRRREDELRSPAGRLAERFVSRSNSASAFQKLRRTQSIF